MAKQTHSDLPVFTFKTTSPCRMDRWLKRWIAATTLDCQMKLYKINVDVQCEYRSRFYINTVNASKPQSAEKWPQSEKEIELNPETEP